MAHLGVPKRHTRYSTVLYNRRSATNGRSRLEDAYYPELAAYLMMLVCGTIVTDDGEEDYFIWLEKDFYLLQQIDPEATWEQPSWLYLIAGT